MWYCIDVKKKKPYSAFRINIYVGNGNFFIIEKLCAANGAMAIEVNARNKKLLITHRFVFSWFKSTCPYVFIQKYFTRISYQPTNNTEVHLTTYLHCA